MLFQVQLMMEGALSRSSYNWKQVDLVSLLLHSISQLLCIQNIVLHNCFLSSRF